MTGQAARKLIVTADGGSRGNPGPAGYGAVVLDAATGEVLTEVQASIGRATNNTAEYSGLIAGLRAAAQIAPGAAVEVKMDSKLVVEQMSGRWKIKHPDLRSLATQASEVAGRLGAVRYSWMPRARNSHADRLANEAMDAAERGGAGSSRAARRSGGNSSAPPAAGSARPPPAADPGGAATGSGAWRGTGAAPTVTVLLRHGETAMSAGKRFDGTSDAPLTEIGMRQAKAAAARLAARGGLALIVTSPLLRARQTAAEVAAATGAAVRIEAGLRECDFGKWEGLSFAEASEQWPDEMAAWMTSGDSPPPGGESFAEAGLRAGAALDQLLAAQQGRTVLIVSHVTPVKEIVARALLAPSPAALFRMHLDVASLCEVAWYPDGPAVLRSFNDTAHLRGL